jgi:hypothetical protein
MSEKAGFGELTSQSDRVIWRRRHSRAPPSVDCITFRGQGTDRPVSERSPERRERLPEALLRLRFGRVAQSRAVSFWRE